MSNHTRLVYDFVRQTTQPEPIKTGGIIIKPEDTIPSSLNELHTDPKSHETYASLKPWTQIMKEQGGIVHAGVPLSEITNTSISTPAFRIDERPVSDCQPTRVKSRQFNYEYSRVNAEEDPVKTGGIVINPQDVRSVNRLDLQTDTNSGLSYAMLKPWAQIQSEQAGIVHNQPLENETKPTVDEIDKKHRRRTSLKQVSTDRTNEPVKIGGILINPEDMLPSRRQELRQQEVGRDTFDRSHYEILHRPLNQVGHSDQIEPKFVPSKPLDIEHIPGAHTTRNIKPEDMLPGMRDLAQDGQVPFAVREREFNYEISRATEPEKIGGIRISPEDVLSSRRHQVEGRDTVQLHRRAVSAIRQRNSGTGYYEYSRDAVEQEPVKTGGIVIDPRDVNSIHRLELQVDPNSHLTYAQLKPWSQIQGEQAGVVHSDAAKNLRHSMTKKDLNIFRTTEREPLKGGKGTMLVNKEDMLPIGSSAPAIREFDLEFTRSSDVGLREPVKGGKGTMLVNQEDMLPQYKTFTGQREFDFEYSRPVEREPIMGGKGTMLVNREDMLPQMQTDTHGIANFEKLNPETRELLNSHSRSKSLGYGMSSFQSTTPQSYLLEPVKLSDYSGKQALGSVELPTLSTLTELDARIDSILNRSKNMLSAVSVSSLTHLGEYPEPFNFGQTSFTGVGSYLGAY